MDNLSAITNFIAISDQLGTSGMPTAAQLTEIAGAGYTTVVNLARDESPGALPGEADLVRSMGMEYIHIPVVWVSPQIEEVERFFNVMDEHKNQKVFVHCVMNYRVSAFVYLYRILRLGITEEEAWQDLTRIWTPDGVWAELISRFSENYISR